MWIVYSLLILLLLLAVFLALTPISLRLDTYRGQYYVQVWGLAKAWFEWEQSPLVKIKVPFYVFELDPLKAGRKKGRKSEVNKKAATTKAVRKRRPKRILSKMTTMIKSFKVREFKLDLDTNDVVRNAYWFPVFFHLNRQTQGQWLINYEGRNGLVLHIENQLIRMLWAFIK